MILETISLEKKYDNKTTIGKIDLRINKGEVYGLIGPNGAGKTTIIGMITSLIKPTNGTVKIYNEDLYLNESRAKLYLGLLPHETLIFTKDTPLKNLIFYGLLSGLNKQEAYDRSAEVLHKVGLLENKHKDISKLSNGMKKKMGIAQAIMNNPRLLILDEPFSGLDAQSKIEVRKIIKNLIGENAIIISSHNLEEIDKLCSKIGIIKHGKIILEENIDKLKLKKNCFTLIFEKFSGDILKKIKKIKSVIKVEGENEKLLIYFKNNIDGLNILTKFFNKEKCSPSSIIKGVSIEDVFIEYTQ